MTLEEEEWIRHYRYTRMPPKGAEAALRDFAKEERERWGLLFDDLKMEPDSDYARGWNSAMEIAAARIREGQ